MMTHRLSLEAFDQATIPAISWHRPGACAQGAPFLLVHGLGMDKHEHLSFYDRLAELLLAGASSVMSIDMRAHGDSEEPSSTLTIANGAADILTATADLRRRTATSRVRLFATSFGAISALAAFTSRPSAFSTVTLLSPALNLAGLYLEPVAPERASWSGFREAVLNDELWRIGERISFTKANLVEFEMFDPVMVARSLGPKLAVVHGDRDAQIPVGMSREVLSGSDGTLVIVPSMGHGFTEEGDLAGDRPQSAANLRLIADVALRDS